MAVSFSGFRVGQAGVGCRTVPKHRKSGSLPLPVRQYLPVDCLPGTRRGDGIGQFGFYGRSVRLHPPIKPLLILREHLHAPCTLLWRFERGRCSERSGGERKAPSFQENFKDDLCCRRGLHRQKGNIVHRASGPVGGLFEAIMHQHHETTFACQSGVCLERIVWLRGQGKLSTRETRCRLPSLSAPYAAFS